VSEALAIEFVGVSKHYGPREALTSLDLQVPKGSIYGFVGRNGAGKTTTIKVLLGMTRPTSGHARVLDRPASEPASSLEIRRRTGFVSEDKDLYDFMTVGEIVAFTAHYYPRWRVDLQERYLRAFELPLSANVQTLSRGARSKLGLLLACCRGAELLVLDEPTSGLDPAVADEVLQLLVTHVTREDATVFMCSRHLADIGQIADRVGIIHRGQMVLTGALEELRDGFRRIQIVFDHDAPPITFRAPGVVRVRRDGRVLTVTARGHVDDIRAEAWASGAVSIDVAAVPLKDMFLDLVAAED
jgi:ABC-2 type transport system ATP-binding protein